MMSSVRRTHDAIPPRRAPVVYAERQVVRTRGLAPLLYALNFATGLPPDELTFPRAAYPEIRPGSDSLVSTDHLSAILDRPTQEIGCGEVMLGDVDERLDGLVISLEAVRVIDGGDALIALGVVRADRAAGGGSSATGDLWELVREALVRHEVSCEHPGSIGDDAFLAVYGRTVLAAWLTGDRLVTVSVTDLRGEQDGMVRAARSIAGYVAGTVSGCGMYFASHSS